MNSCVNIVRVSKRRLIWLQEGFGSPAIKAWSDLRSQDILRDAVSKC